MKSCRSELSNPRFLRRALQHGLTSTALALGLLLTGCGGGNGPGAGTAADPSAATAVSSALDSETDAIAATTAKALARKPPAPPPVPVTTVPIPKRSVYVGNNLAGIDYWTTQFPFVDLMKNGTGWEVRTDASYTGPQPPVFPGLKNGYPTSLYPGQSASATVAWFDTHHPLGDHVVLWDGDGSIVVDSEGATVLASTSNRLVVRITADKYIGVRIVRTNPANPVANLRFLIPGAESTHATQPFNLEFLNKTAPFSSVRFMGWGAMNNSPQVEWADRAQLADVNYTGRRGVPFERMIDLANALRLEPWFCIPHQASDDYVRQLATLIRTRLDPSLRFRIEYSNEMWNTNFEQTQWGVAQSQKLGLPTTSGQPWAFYAQRAVQIFNIFQSTFGPTDSKRMVRVLGGQAAWTQFQTNALGWKTTAANVDVLAIAPYFAAPGAGDPAQQGTTVTLSDTQLAEQMLTNIRGEVKGWVVQNAKLASDKGLRLEGYEGGFGNTTSYFPDGGAAVTPVLARVNRSPVMRDVYTEFYGMWAANGGQLLNQYNDCGAWSKWGFWGALEYINDPAASAPKYQALLDFIATH